MKIQSAKLAEATLKESSQSDCLRRALCLIGTMKGEQFPQVSLGQSLANLNTMLTEMVEQVQQFKGKAEQDFPYLHQSIARYARKNSRPFIA